MIEIQIINNDVIYFPLITGEITWETQIKDAPGKLTFNVIKDSIIDFIEGNEVRFFVDKKSIFCGYVFTKKRVNSDVISVTAFDQLRYLKNKDTYIYENKKASDIVNMISSDFNLKTGEIQDTSYVISERSDDNITLFDIINNALYITKLKTGNEFVLYDDFGKLTLKNINDMKVENFLIDKNNSTYFDYKTTVDENTYSKVRLRYKSKKKGERKYYTLQNDDAIKKWGVLQYDARLEEGENLYQTAKSILEQHNKKYRLLTMIGVIGNLNVRGGSLILVDMSLGDIYINDFFTAEKVIHSFFENEHFMKITLRSQDFTI